MQSFSVPAQTVGKSLRAVLLLAIALLASACAGRVDNDANRSELDGVFESADSPNAAAQLPSPSASAFESWLEVVRATEPPVENLYYAYYDTDSSRPWFLSTMVSAEVLRYKLRLGDVNHARAIGDALLSWQHDGSGKHGERIRGAFPSEIEKQNGAWTARYLYDSSDSMAVMEALLDLYEQTDDNRYLRAADSTGIWLRDVMSHGEKFGVWLESLSAPMKAVTSSGDFDNRIAVGRTLFWLPVLDRLSRLTGDGSFAELAADAKALLSLGQMENGGYADHYDPGWPAEPFDLSRFSAYAKDGSVVADDSLRAALAAEQAGDHEAVARFTRWLPSEQGRIVGYLNLESGEPHFPAGNKKYFDLISSALYYRLSSAVRADDVNAAVQFLTKTQAANGGWHWGWDAHKNAAIDSNQSTLTGLWILTDLSPLG